MILFGWGHCTKKNHGATLPITCPNCNNQTVYELVNMKEWFTLFFIPIIPYKSKHYLLCNICSQGLALKAQQVEKAKRMSRLCKSLAVGQITEEVFAKEMSNISLFEEKITETKPIDTEKENV